MWRQRLSDSGYVQRDQPVGLELRILALNQGSRNVARRQRSYDAYGPVRNLLLVLLHLAVTAAKLCGPGGVRAVIAENLVLKQQAARSAPRSPTGTQPDVGRPIVLRNRNALPQSRSNSRSRDRPPSRDAAGVSSSAGAPQVLHALLLQVVSEENRPERSRQRPHSGDRRTQSSQSSIRLSANCAHHLADVRGRDR
jgi:hypothetical protein